MPDGLSIQIASLEVWDFSRGLLPTWPIVFLKVASEDGTAAEAIAVIDKPIYREIAARFLSGSSCREVADSMGLDILDAHATATLLGLPLPEERPELIAFLGDLYASREIKANRRVARRG